MSIKYRTGQGTSASDFTDLVVKVGDTLPIGTEVDYDGQTVPAGWQEVSSDLVVEDVKGKNLLPFTGSVTQNGITYTANDDGSVVANGTATAVSFQENVVILPSGTYTLSGCPSGGSNNSYKIMAMDENFNSLGDDFGNGMTFTLNSKTLVRVRIRVANGYNITNAKFYPQIEQGNTKTGYSVYLQPLSKLSVVNNYSYNEKKIGTWIDGKPLYRKVIGTTAPSVNDTNTNIYTFVENIENVVNMYGYVYYQSASYKGSINCYITNADYIATWVLVNSNGIPTNIRCRQNNRISAPMRIIIEYTKTTD